MKMTGLLQVGTVSALLTTPLATRFLLQILDLLLLLWLIVIVLLFPIVNHNINHPGSLFQPPNVWPLVRVARSSALSPPPRPCLNVVDVFVVLPDLRRVLREQ